MDKTISISLGGFSFILDEIAYNKLKIYLEDVKKSLRGTDGIEDIIEDVEIRISELFRERIQYREVVSESDVDAVIEIMGHPDQYIYEDEDSGSNESNYYKSENNQSFGGQQTGKKRLFRDPDDSIISGLSSGLAHYLGVDPWFIRAIWLVLGILGVFTKGVSLLFVLFCYFILLIFVQKARTTSQKLQMYGQPANIDTLKKNVEQASEAVLTGGKELSNRLGGVFELFGRIILWFLGFIILAVGLGFITGGFFLIFTTWTDIPTELFGYLVEEKWMSLAAKILGGILVIIPGVLLTILGVKCFWNKARVSKSIIISSIVIWFITLLGIAAIFLNTMSKFRNSVDVSDEKVFNIASDTLNIDFRKEDGKSFAYKSFNNLDQLIDEKGNLVISKREEFEIEESDDNNFHLEIKYSSKGGTAVESKRNLDAIRYNYSINGNNLILDEFLKISKTGKFRDQEVDVKLLVPKNKILFIKNADYVRINNGNYDSDNLYDLKNNSIKFNGKKFVCLDCNNNESSEDEDYNINIKDGKDSAKVIIDKNGIRVQNGQKSVGVGYIKNTNKQINYKDDTDSININYGSNSKNR